MGIFDTIKNKLADSERVRTRLEELKAKDKNGELSAQGKVLLSKLRERMNK